MSGILHNIFSDLMERHSNEVKRFMKHRQAFVVAEQIALLWGPMGTKDYWGKRHINIYSSSDGTPIVWLRGGKKDSMKELAIFIDEHLENNPDLEFVTRFEGDDPDLTYQVKGDKSRIRFMFDMGMSDNCRLVLTKETREVYKRVCK